MSKEAKFVLLTFLFVVVLAAATWALLSFA